MMECENTAVAWRYAHAFLLNYQLHLSNNRKTDHDKLLRHIESISDFESEAEWEEQATRIMFYGDARVTPELEQKVMDVFAKSLMESKIERKSRNVIILLETIIEHHIMHPEIIKTFEHLLNFKVQLTFVDDIVGIVKAARNCNNFSDRFYDRLFMQGIKLLPYKPASDTVLLLKTFSDKKDYLEQLAGTNTKLKEHIAQDMARSTLPNICYLIELYKNDAPFSKYLLTCLLEKMADGKKIDFETFLIAFLHSLKHKEHLEQLIDTLLNFEVFFSSNYFNQIYTILEAIMEERLYEHEQGIRLIKAIQLQLAFKISSGLKNPNESNSLRRLFYLHQYVPVLEPYFLMTLMRIG